jgi:beta-galactosidase
MMPACISDVFVRTSTRRREIALDIELRGIAGADAVQFTAILLDEAGREERCFSTQAAVQAAEAQTITLAWPWPDPRLWDLEQPNLYVLRLSAEGCGLDPSAAYTQTFGFREFWIEGRRFFLNGAELRLRPVLAANLTDPQAIEAAIAGYRWAGFNIAEIWPGPEAERSAAVWCDVADRLGGALTGPAGPGGDALNARATGYIGGAVGTDSAGHSARAAIRLCTQNGPSGTCVDKTVEFTIP